MPPMHGSFLMFNQKNAMVKTCENAGTPSPGSPRPMIKLELQALLGYRQAEHNKDVRVCPNLI